ncbi:hypothetical protein Gotur_015332 [Gossypium turneri]
MAVELIRLDHKHIFIEQMKMSIDWVLQCYIRNMSSPSSPLIENYLKEAGFWHVATISQGCKLDPKLISELVDRGRPETHTFYLSCEECTITLGDVQLQLGLLMDRFALTEFIQSDTFLEPRNDSTEVERIRYAQAYILEMIRGYLMLDLSRNLVHLRWLLKLVDFRAVGKFSWGSAIFAPLY